MDIFYKMQGVSINGTDVNCSNITEFKLHKRFESPIADIYSSLKKSKYGQFIIHIKKPDEYAKNNNYLLSKGKQYPEVDWFEHSRGTGETLDDDIAYIEERL
jgi:hypothetical protein